MCKRRIKLSFYSDDREEFFMDAKLTIDNLLFASGMISVYGTSWLKEEKGEKSTNDPPPPVKVK